MTYGFDTITCQIEHKGRIVARVVMQAQARFAVGASAARDACRKEHIDLLARLRLETSMPLVCADIARVEIDSESGFRVLFSHHGRARAYAEILRA